MIYIVEDDAAIRELEQYALQSSGYEVASFESSEPFWQAMHAAEPELVILDVMLPGEDGFSILKKLRAAPATAEIPVILATAKGTEFDKVIGLDTGADDYLVKPFHIRELLARIRALTRRPVEIQERKTITAYGLVLDAEYRRLTYQGKSVILTQKETNLITVFLEQPDMVQSRSQLLWKVWGGNTEVEDGNVDNYIHFMRKRLRELGCKVSIKTVYGAGYRLEETP